MSWSVVFTANMSPRAHARLASSWSDFFGPFAVFSHGVVETFCISEVCLWMNAELQPQWMDVSPVATRLWMATFSNAISASPATPCGRKCPTFVFFNSTTMFINYVVCVQELMKLLKLKFLNIYMTCTSQTKQSSNVKHRHYTVYASYTNIWHNQRLFVYTIHFPQGSGNLLKGTLNKTYLCFLNVMC